MAIQKVNSNNIMTQGPLANIKNNINSLTKTNQNKNTMQKVQVQNKGIKIDTKA